MTGTETFRQRVRHIRKSGARYGESAPYYIWDSRLQNPCGHPVQGFAKLCRLLKRHPYAYATGDIHGLGIESGGLK